MFTTTPLHEELSKARDEDREVKFRARRYEIAPIRDDETLWEGFVAETWRLYHQNALGLVFWQMIEPTQFYRVIIPWHSIDHIIDKGFYWIAGRWENKGRPHAWEHVGGDVGWEEMER